MTPSQQVHEKLQMLCWYTGVAYVVMLTVGFFLLMGFFPPPPPGLTPDELMAKFGEHEFAIKSGIVICIIGCALLIPWSVMMAIQTARMERGRLPILAITSLGGGLINALLFILPFIFWSAAFYRFDRDPNLILLINDMTWLEFVSIWPPVFIQQLCISAAGFISTAKTKDVLPRWFLYLNIWVSLLFTPGILAIYFFDGPFAWNGILAIWIPFTVFGIWWAAALPVFYKAIKTHKFEVE